MIKREDYDEPKWTGTSRVHDWRNYIGERTQALWSTFIDEQKSALANDADYLASLEHWD